MSYIEIDGCVAYHMPDDEPDAQAELIADVSDYAIAKHSMWLCEECAPTMSTMVPFAKGVCESCGRESYVTHLVRTPKPTRQEARV